MSLAAVKCIARPLAYLSLPYFALRYISARHAPTRYYVRLTVFTLALAACSLWGVVISLAVYAAGRRYDLSRMVARSFNTVAGYLLDIKVEVEGEEYLDQGPALYVSNHQSSLDLLVLGRVFPHRSVIMAKKELRWVPALGMFMQLSGAVWIDRGNHERAMESLREASATLKSNRVSLWVFPEGTRTLWTEPNLRTFKKGAFHIAIQSGLPIIPVICENSRHIYREGAVNPGVLKVRVLPPIPTESLTSADVTELMESTRELMLKTVREISRNTSPSAVAKSDTTPAPEEPARTPTPTPQLVQSLVSSVIEETVPDSEVAGDKTESEVGGTNGSEGRSETDEDEGMVLVGRPSA